MEEQNKMNLPFLPDKIEKPKDQRKVRQLELKLMEYRKRLHFFQRVDSRLSYLNELLGEIGAESFTNEEVGGEKMIDWMRDTYYKTIITRMLLDVGVVNPYALERVMMDRDPEGFEPGIFCNAAGVINDYIETGGEHISGGTGLDEDIN